MAAELPASTSEVVLKHGGATPETKGPHLAGLWKSFADTQAGKRTQTGSICLVASELSTLFLNGGIGTYFHLIAHLLAAQAWRVHILYAGQVHDEAALARAPRTLAEAGIGFSHLRDFELPKIPRIMSRHQPWYLQTSWKIRYALEELHR
ncbi:MAG: hypothetical protein JO112_23320, partial [Planctomycetes bacterium]|nr:hypothetical protein [Planctomycetota bacterium]